MVHLMGLNKMMIETAAAIEAETGWELAPGEVRANVDYQAAIDIDAWLQSGATDQFSWSV